jgi:protein tyrosine/serine phosphatase
MGQRWDTFNISIHLIWWSRNNSLQGIVEAFTDILTHGAPACRMILLHVCSLNPQSSIVSTPDVPDSAFYIHCTTGNNRSGVFIGVILSLLGVKPQHIAEEYALSEIGLRPTRDKVVSRLMKSPVFAGAGGGGKIRAERMVGARPESMLAMLEMVNRKWGSAEGYVKAACELTDEEVEKVKQVLTYTEVKVPESTSAGGHKRSRSFVARLWDSLSKPKRNQ